MLNIMSLLSLSRCTAPLRGNLISIGVTWLVHTPAEGQLLFHFNNGKAQMLTTCSSTCFWTKQVSKQLIQNNHCLVQHFYGLIPYRASVQRKQERLTEVAFLFKADSPESHVTQYSSWGRFSVLGSSHQTSGN
ncbi:hypothetical protein KIL84_021722 [Mauremys mutica]|uniref:Uncharacterized protein n=1 Tax=Mauremys mutica TaxID=74926 RepID=A0A9D3XCJ2_9SAUR|nr:hypothetical protein KIL84_021722 [Mauremys mutica]